MKINNVFQSLFLLGVILMTVTAFNLKAPVKPADIVKSENDKLVQELAQDEVIQQYVLVLKEHASIAAKHDAQTSLEYLKSNEDILVEASKRFLANESYAKLSLEEKSEVFNALVAFFGPAEYQACVQNCGTVKYQICIAAGNSVSYCLAEVNQCIQSCASLL